MNTKIPFAIGAAIIIIAAVFALEAMVQKEASQPAATAPAGTVQQHPATSTGIGNVSTTTSTPHPIGGCFMVNGHLVCA